MAYPNENAGENSSADGPSDAHIPTVLSKLQKWGDYASVGEPVRPSKFVPMKTPLSHAILDNWTLPKKPKHRLTVPEMLETQAQSGRRVGLILDLSNHNCLYTSDIPDSVEYLHVHLVAKELPPADFVREVASLANEFWSRKPNDHVAIHCAYGFNRTGFVVCCYLIEHCGLTVDEALDSFATSRPPGVKHEQFRNELRRRYDPTWVPPPPSLLLSPSPMLFPPPTAPFTSTPTTNAIQSQPTQFTPGSSSSLARSGFATAAASSPATMDAAYRTPSFALSSAMPSLASLLGMAGVNLGNSNSNTLTPPSPSPSPSVNGLQSAHASSLLLQSDGQADGAHIGCCAHISCCAHVGCVHVGDGMGNEIASGIGSAAVSHSPSFFNSSFHGLPGRNLSNLSLSHPAANLAADGLGCATTTSSTTTTARNASTGRRGMEEAKTTGAGEEERSERSETTSACAWAPDFADGDVPVHRLPREMMPSFSEAFPLDPGFIKGARSAGSRGVIQAGEDEYEEGRSGCMGSDHQLPIDAYQQYTGADVSFRPNAGPENGGPACSAAALSAAASSMMLEGDSASAATAQIPRRLSVQFLKELASPADESNQSLGCSPSIFRDEGTMRLMREASSKLGRLSSRTFSTNSLSSEARVSDAGSDSTPHAAGKSPTVGIPEAMGGVRCDRDAAAQPGAPPPSCGDYSAVGNGYYPLMDRGLFGKEGEGGSGNGEDGIGGVVVGAGRERREAGGEKNCFEEGKEGGYETRHEHIGSSGIVGSPITSSGIDRDPALLGFSEIQELGGDEAFRHRGTVPTMAMGERGKGGNGEGGDDDAPLPPSGAGGGTFVVNVADASAPATAGTAAAAMTPPLRTTVMAPIAAAAVSVFAAASRQRSTRAGDNVKNASCRSGSPEQDPSSSSFFENNQQGAPKEGGGGEGERGGRGKECEECEDQRTTEQTAAPPVLDHVAPYGHPRHPQQQSREQSREPREGRKEEGGRGGEKDGGGCQEQLPVATTTMLGATMPIDSKNPTFANECHQQALAAAVAATVTTMTNGIPSEAEDALDLYRQYSENDSLGLSDRVIFQTFSMCLQERLARRSTSACTPGVSGGASGSLSSPGTQSPKAAAETSRWGISSASGGLSTAVKTATATSQGSDEDVAKGKRDKLLRNNDDEDEVARKLQERVAAAAADRRPQMKVSLSEIDWPKN